MNSEANAAATPRIFNPWLIAVTVTLATFMEILDSSIANIALPHIAGALGASTDESTWVLTSYLVSSAIVLPLSGWLTTVMGRKRFYMTCVAIFTASSVLCGLSVSLPMLIISRILQGAGGGGLQKRLLAYGSCHRLPDTAGLATGKTYQSRRGGYAKPGDQLTLHLNPPTQQVQSISVKTFLDTPDDPLTIALQFSKLDDGTTYPSVTTIEAPSKKISITTLSTDFSKPAQ